MKYFFSELHLFQLPKKVHIILFLLPFIHIITTIFILTSLERASNTEQQHDTITGRGLYANIILQGMDGNWKTALPYTTEQYPRVFGYNFFFIILGQVNRLFHIDHIFLYTTTTILAGIFLLIGTYWVLRQLLPPSLAVIAYFFIHFIETGIYLPSLSLGTALWVPSFYIQQNLIERHFGLPHHTFGKAIGFIFLAAFLRYANQPKLRWLSLIIVTSIIGAFILPPVMLVIIIAVILPFTAVELLKKKVKVLFPLILSSGIIGSTAFFLQKQLALIPELAVYSTREKTWWDNNDILIRYSSSLLFYYPLFIISIIGLCIYRKSLSKRSLQFLTITISWLIIPALLIPISSLPFFPLVNARLVDGYQYVPAGIFAAIGITFILAKATNAILRHLTVITVLVVIFVSTCTTALFSKSYIAKHSFPYYNIYPATAFWKSLRYIQSLPKNSNFLMDDTLSEVVPSYAEANIYVTAPGATWPFYDGRKEKMVKFYQGEYSSEDAKNFLQLNHIEYVYYGIAEQLISAVPPPYPELLNAVYKTNQVTIYQVKKEK